MSSSRIDPRLEAHIERWRDNLIDLDIAVADARLAVDAAVQTLRAAVRERERAHRHLGQLMAMRSGDAA